MSDSRIEATGLYRKYEPPSLKKLIGISFGGTIWFFSALKDYLCLLIFSYNFTLINVKSIYLYI